MNTQWNKDAAGCWVYRYQIKAATTEQLRIEKNNNKHELIKLKVGGELYASSKQPCMETIHLLGQGNPTVGADAEEDLNSGSDSDSEPDSNSDSDASGSSSSSSSTSRSRSSSRSSSSGSGSRSSSGTSSTTRTRTRTSSTSSTSTSSTTTSTTSTTSSSSQDRQLTRAFQQAFSARHDRDRNLDEVAFAKKQCSHIERTIGEHAAVEREGNLGLYEAYFWRAGKTTTRFAAAASDHVRNYRGV